MKTEPEMRWWNKLTKITKAAIASMIVDMKENLPLMHERNKISEHQ